MRIRNAIIAGLATVGLGGCTSDPAFWDAVAQGLDQAAYEMANEPVCTWYTDRFGMVQQSCVPAYTLNAPNYVVTTPTYYSPAPYYGDRDRDRDRDGRDRRDRRDGKPHGDNGRNDRNDRNDRRDHDGRRGPKGE